MSELSANEIPTTDLLEHPAVKAWGKLHPERVEPDRIDVLYNERKTQVYQLHGVGPAGSGIIAKRCRQGALVERKIYEEILPQLPVTGLGYYGFVEEPEGRYRWLFLEEAGGEPYSPLLEEHRRLAAQWLGSLHTSAAKLSAVASLPGRGPGYYLQELRTARDELRQGLSNPVLTVEDMRIVRAVISQLDLLERHWKEAAEFCSRIPPSLVHGDLAIKNVRVREGKYLMVMDWEMAGWGVPAIDLTQLASGSRSVSPDLHAYWSSIQVNWPHIDAQDVRQLAHFGRMFRVIVMIRWASQCLPFPWVDDELQELRHYDRRLTAFLEAANWG